MAFRRFVASLGGQILLFACGGLFVLAVTRHFYGSLLLVGLVAVLIALTTAYALTATSEARRAPPPFRDLPGREAALWRAYVEHAPTPLLAVTPDGSAEALNRAARRLFGVDGRIVDRELVAAIVAARPGERGELRLLTPDGHRIFALTVTELRHGQDSSRVAALTDIQIALRAAEVRASREIISVLSHEIMNLMTPISSLAQTAVEDLDLASPSGVEVARRTLDLLAARAAGLSRFVATYRAAARIPAPTRRDVRLERFLDETAELWRSAWRTQTVCLEVKAGPQTDVHIDVDLMTQALLNTLNNAAEAALSGGDDARIELSAVSRDGRVVIQVEDNGPGVPEALRDDIFLPFVSSKANGRGVGLYLARQVALAHGGDLILLSTEPGRGARLQFEI